jgi:hypothetical protein
MAEQGAITTETVTVWEYEYKGEEGNYWLPESTQERTLERAAYRTSTGRVRSQERTITTVRGPWTEFAVTDSVSDTSPQE